MDLSTVHQGVHKRKRKKRVGRGVGSGHGKTASRGHKGQYSSAGAKYPPSIFEGGQMPLFRRIPKRGFSHATWDKEFLVVNVGDLDAFDDGATVGPDELKKAGLAKGPADGVRVLGTGELSKKLTVRAHHFSKSAAEKITAIGGTAEVIPPPKRPKKNKMRPRTCSTRARDSMVGAQSSLSTRSEEHERDARMARTLARQGKDLATAGRLQDARRALRKALEVYGSLAKTNLQEYDAQVANTLMNLGEIYHQQDRLEEAEATYRRAEEYYEVLSNTQADTYLLLLDRVRHIRADILIALGRLEDAEHVYRSILAACQRKISHGRPQIAFTYEKIADTLRGLCRHEEADDAYRQALQHYRELLPQAFADYAPAVARTLSSLGATLTDLGKFSEAEEVYREAEIHYRSLAVDNPEDYTGKLAAVVHNRANALAGLGQHKDAEEAYRRALATCRELALVKPDSYNPLMATVLNNLAEVLERQGSVTEAGEACREALELMSNLNRPLSQVEELEETLILTHAGRLLKRVGRARDAQRMYQTALQRLEPYELPLWRSKILTEFGQLLSLQGEGQQALVCLNQAVEQVERLHLDSLPIGRREEALRNNARVYESLLSCLMDLGEKWPGAWDEALKVSEQAKQRRLLDLLALQDPKPTVPECQEYEQLLRRGLALMDDLRRL